MAASPDYAGAGVRFGSAVVSSTADTSYTAPSNKVTVASAGTSGSKIDELRFVGTGTTIAGTVNVFYYDGSTYHLIDAIQVPAWIASTTVPPWTYVKPYSNLVLAASSSIVATSTVGSQLVNVSAFGGDF